MLSRCHWSIFAQPAQASDEAYGQLSLTVTWPIDRGKKPQAAGSSRPRPVTSPAVESRVPTPPPRLLGLGGLQMPIRLVTYSSDISSCSSVGSGNDNHFLIIFIMTCKRFLFTQCSDTYTQCVRGCLTLPIYIITYLVACLLTYLLYGLSMEGRVSTKYASSTSFKQLRLSTTWHTMWFEM